MHATAVYAMVYKDFLTEMDNRQTTGTVPRRCIETPLLFLQIIRIEQVKSVVKCCRRQRQNQVKKLSIALLKIEEQHSVLLLMKKWGTAAHKLLTFDVCNIKKK